MEKRLQAVEMWFLRRMMQMSLIQRKMNEDVTITESRNEALTSLINTKETVAISGRRFVQGRARKPKHDWVDERGQHKQMGEYESHWANQKNERSMEVEIHGRQRSQRTRHLRGRNTSKRMNKTLDSMLGSSNDVIIFLMVTFLAKFDWSRPNRDQIPLSPCLK